MTKSHPIIATGSCLGRREALTARGTVACRRTGLCLILAALVAAPLPLSAAAPAADPWVLPAGVTVITGETLEVPGDIRIPSGSLLSLNSSILLFGGPPGQRLTVESGGTLIAGSTRFLSSGASGHWFSVDAQPGSRLGLTDCRIEGAGTDVPDPLLRGVRLASSTLGVRNCTVANAPAGLVFDGAPSSSQVESIRFEGVATPVIALNGSLVTLLDTQVAAPEVEVNSTVCFDFTLRGRFVTTFNFSVPLVDFEARQGATSLYATPGFGGNDPVIRDNLFGEQLEPVFRAPGRCAQAWNATLLRPVTLTARLGDWSEVRELNLTGPSTQVFHPAPAFTTFSNITAQAGVEGNGRWDADTYGPGAAWGDFDRDGLLDLYVTDSRTLGVFVPLHKGPNHLYRQNADHTFSEVTNETGTATNGSYGASWGDFDNDADLDLYLTNYGDGSTFYSPGEPNVLFKNLLSESGVARFADVTEAAGVGGSAHSTSSAWGDYDNDGWLDLYVANLGIMNHMTWWLRNESNVLYRNNRNGTFTDVTFSVGGEGGVAGGNFEPGMGDPQQFVFIPVAYNGTRDDYTTDWVGGLNRDKGPSGMSFAAAWFDADRDGDLDLLVGNDHGLNAFYRNSGDGTFRDDTLQAGFGIIGSGMGFAVGDYDSDGDLDVYQSNFNLDYLWRNRGDGTFEEVSARAGLEDVLVGWATAFADFDNDGDLDLFVDNGRVFQNASMLGSRSKPERQPDRIYRNNDDGTFTEVTGTAGLENDLNSMGAGVADFDRDGDVDIYVGNTDGPETLWRNNAQAEAPKAWLEVELIGTVSNRDGVGAKVQVSAGGRSFFREMTGGSSYLTSNPSILHFGLANATRVDAVDVFWPSGLHTRLTDLPPSQIVKAKEEAPFLASAGPDFEVDEDTPFHLNGGLTVYEGSGVAFRRALTWSFVEGSGARTLSGVSPEVVISRPGVYDITLAADDLAGAVRTDNVLVTVRDKTAPSVSLGPDRTVDEGTLVEFSLGNATDNDAGFPSGARFEFEVVGAEGTSIFSGDRLEYAPPSPGVYLVRGAVTDAAGNRGVSALRLYVRDLTAPTLEVAPSKVVRAGELLEIAPLRLADNDPAFNTTGTVTWSFGVGENCRVPVTVYGRQLIYRFETPGSYAVTVNATDASGHSTLRTITVIVEGFSGGATEASSVWPFVGVGAAAAALSWVALRRRRGRSGEGTP